MFSNTKYVQKLSGLLLVLRYERAPRDAVSSELVLTCLDLFAVGILAPDGPGSVVGIVTGYGLDGPGIESVCNVLCYEPVALSRSSGQ